MALKYAPAAFEELARISTKGESEAVRIAATKEILDRAFGKAVAHLEANLKTDVSSLTTDEILQHLAALGVVAQSARDKDEGASLH